MARVPRPSHLVPIAHLRPGDQNVSFIGVVEKFDPPRQGKLDYYISMRLQDDFEDRNANTLAVKIFRSQLNQFPKINGIGDVVIIRNVEITEWIGRADVVIRSPFSPEIICFQESQMPSWGSHHAHTPWATASGQERQFAIQLHHSAEATIREVKGKRGHPTPAQAMAAPAPKKISQKLAHIKDMEPFKFYDVFAEIVKVYHSDRAADIYITDYTENDALYCYGGRSNPDSGGRNGDPYGYAPVPKAPQHWEGPVGCLTLQVRLFPPHSEWAQQNLRQGDLVLLRNLNTKFSPVGKLEARLFTDPQRTENVGITKLHSRHYQAEMATLMEAKKQYEKQFGKDTDKKPSALKASLKTTKKQEKKRKKAEKEGVEKTHGGPKAAIEQPWEEAVVEHQFEGDQANQSLTGYNKHVRCAHLDKPLSALQDIIDGLHLYQQIPAGQVVKLPFKFTSWRARVRVVDFSPGKLEDFARSLDDPSYNDTLDPDFCNLMHLDPPDRQPSGRWVWAFCLLVEDAMPAPGTKPARMKLYVGNEGGEYLLKMDATNLREDKRALMELREKLFLLWGNLQELTQVKIPLFEGGTENWELGESTKALSNLPFECCFQEYEMFDPRKHKDRSEAEHRHQIFGTTIVE